MTHRKSIIWIYALLIVELLSISQTVFAVSADHASAGQGIEKLNPRSRAALGALLSTVQPRDFWEFYDLPPEAMAPVGLVTKYGTETFARMIIMRLHLKFEQDLSVSRESPFSWLKPEDLYEHVHGYDYFQGTEIQIFFGPEVIDGIFETGIFKNLHQTRSTKAQYDPIGRRTVESLLSGIQFPIYRTSQVINGIVTYTDLAKEVLAELLPKYSNIDILDDSIQMQTQQKLSSLAGGIAAVMKPSIKDRMTWMDGDSYDSIGPTNRHGYTMEQLVKRGRVGTFYSSELLGWKGTMRQVYGYREGQIWGPVEVHDVDYFLIDPNLPNAAINKLKRLGKAIYTWRIVEVGPNTSSHKTHYVKDALIFGSRCKDVFIFEGK